MKEKISKYINTQPTVFEIAKDNMWEEAWIIKISDGVPATGDIKKYLDKEPYSYLAVEIQWDQPEGAYVLNIGHSKVMKMKSHEDFIKQLLELSTKKYVDFGVLVDCIDSEVIGRPYLFTQELDFVRVGVFNYWFSEGPVDIWKKGEARSMDKNKLSEMFKGHENVLKTDLNFQAMAFAYTYDFENVEFGLRHIMKVPSSKKVGDKWELDFDLMLKFLSEWEDFKCQN